MAPKPPKGAAKLLKEAAEKAGPKLREATKHRAVEKAWQKGLEKSAEKVITAGFGVATGGVGALYAKKRLERQNRRYAEDLARQLGDEGTYSVGVIIGASHDRFCVVWRGDQPYRVVPELPKGSSPLNELEDLQTFEGPRLKPGPQ